MGVLWSFRSKPVRRSVPSSGVPGFVAGEVNNARLIQFIHTPECVTQQVRNLVSEIIMDGRQQIVDLIRKVNWAGLKHAYGEASDVSAQLSDLLSDDEALQSAALESLYSNIFHQGSRFEASTQAVPFLLYKLQTEEVKNKPEIIRLLAHLAIGYQESYLPLGFQWRPEPQYSYAAAVQSYNAVGRGTDIFLSLLNHPDNTLRLHAAFILGWFPAKGRQTRNTIVERIAVETCDKTKANLIVALGLLDGYENTRQNETLFREHLRNGTPLVRTASALALTRLMQAETDRETLDVLIKGLETYSGRYIADVFPWQDGDLVGYISSSFHLLGSNAAPILLDPLLAQLASSNAFTGIEIVAVLLRYFFTDPEEGHVVTKESLAPVQRRILETVAANKQMCPDSNEVFLNFWDIFSHYGLPDSPQKLRELLA